MKVGVCFTKQINTLFAWWISLWHTKTYKGPVVYFYRCQSSEHFKNLFVKYIAIPLCLEFTQWSYSVYDLWKPLRSCWLQSSNCSKSFYITLSHTYIFHNISCDHAQWPKLTMSCEVNFLHITFIKYTILVSAVICLISWRINAWNHLLWL